ncbi:hypothetical protein ACFX11_012832 [Malus domestica]
MALCSTAFLCNHVAAAALWSPYKSRARSFRRQRSSIIKAIVTSDVKQDLNTSLQYRKLDDSDLVISEITLQTMTFNEHNTEIEAHEILYAVENGINVFDTTEAYPIPMKEVTQGNTDRHITSWLKSHLRHKVFDSLTCYVARFCLGFLWMRCNYINALSDLQFNTDNITC